MVLYQLCSDGDVIGGFGNTVRVSKERRRSLEKGQVKHCSKEHQNMRALEHDFILLRITPVRLFSVDYLRNAPQKMPRWTVYLAIVTSNKNIHKTNIGYCPMVPAPATEFNTVYTVMIYLQSIFRSLTLFRL